MSAKEMFEELGYYQKSNTKLYLTYERSLGIENRYNGESLKESIVFNKYEKKVGGKIIGKFPSKYWFDYKTIIAINKQVEEFGWNNDN